MERNKENASTQALGDRFIPTQVRSCAFQVENNLFKTEASKTSYEELLEKNILEPRDSNFANKIMSFGKPTQPLSAAKGPKTNVGKTLGKENEGDKKPRKITKKPYKILDAPNLQDDFYLNLIDWSDSNQIAVALDTSLYVWSGCSSEVTKLYETSHVSDYLCSVSFCDESKIAIGNSLGQIKVFDITKKKRVNQFDGHIGRVGSLSWSSGMLASGSRDGTVATWDLRDGLVNQYKAHSQEICGLKWSP